MSIPKHILPTIVISQFLCTSLWFAGNAVMSDLKSSFDLSDGVLAYLTSMVQFGFIVGTLVFALLSIADRYSPSRVFFMCAILGALFNAMLIYEGNSQVSILAFRFFTGFFLAGIYPVGMKIASDYYEKGLGVSLGYLVGALVVGTALPHLLRDLKGSLPWESVILMTSVLAMIGGASMLMLVPDGPFRRASQKVNLLAIPTIFRNRKFRTAAFGYFGHMWELYTFWAFIPLMLTMYSTTHNDSSLNISLLSFIIIGIGGIACVIGGYIAQKVDTKKVATVALLLSCICSLVSPLLFIYGSLVIFILFLLIWGMVVIADSPLFSTMVAHNAPAEVKGTALTIVNCIGFFITIISILLIEYIVSWSHSPIAFIALSIGPVLGLICLKTN